MIKKKRFDKIIEELRKSNPEYTIQIRRNPKRRSLLQIYPRRKPKRKLSSEKQQTDKD